MRDKSWSRRRPSSTIAAAMAQALSDARNAGTAVTSGAQTGFDIDTAGLLDGNTIHSPIPTRRPASSTHHASSGSTIPPRLPLSNTATADPQRRGDRHRFLRRHGVGRRARLNASSTAWCSSPIRPARTCASSTTAPPTIRRSTRFERPRRRRPASPSGGGELPFFTDAASHYTGAITSAGSQSRRACRPHRRQHARCSPIRPSSSCIKPGTATGDPTRPNFIYDQLTTAR